jgi:hypothetical protein
MEVRAVALDARQKFKISLFTIFFAENPLQGKKREGTQMKTNTNEYLADRRFLNSLIDWLNKHGDWDVFPPSIWRGEDVQLRVIF